MRVRLLGTAGYHPNDQRQTHCVLLPECGVMLDAGTGMFRAADYLVTDELDIFLSHLHLDHVVGLTYLFDLLYQHPLRRVTIHAAAAELAALDEHLFAEPLFPKKPPCEFQVLADETSLPGGGRLTHFPLAHTGACRGYRLDWPGHALACVTDTTAEPEATYVERIRGVDLLLHECNFGDDFAELARRTGHSHTRQVAQVARQAEVKRLILLHINPLAPADDPIGLDTARAIFPNTEVGYDRMEVEF